MTFAQRMSDHLTRERIILSNFRLATKFLNHEYGVEKGHKVEEMIDKALRENNELQHELTELREASGEMPFMRR